ncbi:iceA1 [Helicobacter pylori PeCan4]|nr:iceA1 [Helicobacter pylori PeCan4]
MSKSKKELFLELAQPDKNGMSRWVSAIEFIGQGLKLSNGGSWCRSNSSLAKEFELEFDRMQTLGNSIDRIRLNGYKTKCVFNQSIRSRH